MERVITFYGAAHLTGMGVSAVRRAYKERRVRATLRVYLEETEKPLLDLASVLSCYDIDEADVQEKLDKMSSMAPVIRSPYTQKEYQILHDEVVLLEAAIMPFKGVL